MTHGPKTDVLEAVISNAVSERNESRNYLKFLAP